MTSPTKKTNPKLIFKKSKLEDFRNRREFEQLSISMGWRVVMLQNSAKNWRTRDLKGWPLGLAEKSKSETRFARATAWLYFPYLMAYGGHRYRMYAVCDVTRWRHIHVCKPLFRRSLLTQHAYYSTRTLSLLVVIQCVIAMNINYINAPKRYETGAKHSTQC